MSDRPQPRLLLVRWEDSAVQHGWLHADDLQSRPIVCESVGFFVAENDRHLQLALSRGVDAHCHEWAEIISIPKAAIVKRKTLRA